MDVLVSGSSGLVGTHLRRALRTAGHRPIRLVRPSSEADRGETVRWSPSEGRIDAAALEGIDAVVHLAGEPLLGRWTEAKKRRIRDSRVEGTGLLAGTLAELDRPPAVMLSGSAVGYYGSRGDDVLTEDSSPGEGFLARTVQEWEGAARPAADAGIRVVHLRTGVVLSSDAILLKLQMPAFKLGLGGPLGSGEQWFPWVAIDDEVGAIVHLLELEDTTGPVNLTAPNPVRAREFAETLARVLNRPAPLRVPEFAVRAVFGREAAEEMATASQRVVPQRLTGELGYSFTHPDLEPALRDVLDRPA